MEYKIGDIIFNKNMSYDKLLFWNLYRIYCSYNDIDENKKDNSKVFKYPRLDIYSSLTSKYGKILVRGIIDDDQVNQEFYDFVYYKELLVNWFSSGAYMRDKKETPSISSIITATSLEELKDIFDLKKHKMEEWQIDLMNKDKEQWGVDGSTNLEVDVNIEMKNYYERIVKVIPQNILDKITNIELFKLGYIEKSVYDELTKFKEELGNWLKHPTGTDLYYDIDRESPSFSDEFHDCVFFVKKKDSKLELVNDDYGESIICDNCSTIVVNNQNKVIINDYIKSKDYEFSDVEGYDYCGIFFKDSNKKEFILEVNSEDISIIIIETDSVKYV